MFDGPRLLSVGVNSQKTHPRSLLYAYVGREGEVVPVGTHSEMSAVLRLGGFAARGLCLVNTRVNKRGLLDYSRPCRGCLDMITRMGFGRVYHTTREGEFVRMEF